jgi:hypothetical protein
MTFRTGVAFGSLPAAAARTAMSRSVRTPTSRSFSQTGKKPMFAELQVFATVAVLSLPFVAWFVLPRVVITTRCGSPTSIRSASKNAIAEIAITVRQIFDHRRPKSKQRRLSQSVLAAAP